MNTRGSFLRIKSVESCLTAREIADRFREETGHDLFPTNVGNAAKALGLDYVECEVELPGVSFQTRQRRYSEVDLPVIFAWLDALVRRRQAAEQKVRPSAVGTH